jgi:hypothetical protein
LLGLGPAAIAAAAKLGRSATYAMGLKLRYNLFRDASVEAVYGAYASFYAQRGRPLQPAGKETRRLDFYQENNDWVVVGLDGGWEWKERREAQLFASRRLWCAGLLVFVYDGDYWGYELFDHGEVRDHFVQEATGMPIWFAGEDCLGHPEVLAEHLPFLDVEDIAPYLVQKHDWVIPTGMNVPARFGDEFCRFDECAVLDFLRMLGVRVGLQDGYVRQQSPLYRSAFL